LILECSQGCYMVKNLPSDLDLWPMTLKINRVPDSHIRTKYVPSLVKIHWRMLILECSQGCYAVKIWPVDLDLWPWKSIGFQILLMTKYVSSLVKIHWRILILECWQGCYGMTDGSVTISLRNFVGEGIITEQSLIAKGSNWPKSYCKGELLKLQVHAKYMQLSLQTSW
jgi:hypothetical protein